MVAKTEVQIVISAKKSKKGHSAIVSPASIDLEGVMGKRGGTQCVDSGL